MKNKSNCLIFAVNKWFKHGGYLVMRRSKHGFFPHFLWCSDLKNAEIEHFVPINPKHSFVKILFHKILFEGMIKKDDV